MAPRRSSPLALVRTGYQPPQAVAAVPSTTTGEQVKIENWGPGNQLPQELVKLVYDSGTATVCIDRLEQFIGGKGFANQATAERMANPEQTFNQLWAEIANYCAWGLGVAYIIRYPFGGEIAFAELWAGAVDCLRVEKGGAGRYVINFKLAEGKMPTGENQVYLPYRHEATPEEISAEVLAAVHSEAGYHGHLYFNFKYRVGRNVYPIPSWYAAKEDVEADAELPKYELKQLRNGFFPDAILTLVGQKYADVDDPDWTPGPGQSEADRPLLLSPDREQVMKAVKELKGAGSEASILLNVVESEEEKPQLDFVDKGPNSKGLTDMSTRIEGKVYRRFGVPPVLCGVAEAGLLGSNQQIVNSIKLFSLTIEPARALGLDPLKQFFPALDFAVLPLNPVEYIDPAVAAKMTDDELRAVQGLPPLEKLEDTEAQKTLKALNAMSPLLATKALEEMSSEEIRALINLRGSKADALATEASPTPTPTR
jgi:hypothetical protein